MALRIAKAVLVLGALGLTFGLSAVGGLRLALQTRAVPVPDLGSLTPEEARAELADFDLALRVEPLRRVDPATAAGLIAEQEPDPSIATRRGRSVKVWLSSGRTPGSVPALVGASEGRPAGASRRPRSPCAGCPRSAPAATPPTPSSRRTRRRAVPDRRCGCSSTGASAAARTSCPI